MTIYKVDISPDLYSLNVTYYIDADTANIAGEAGHSKAISQWEYDMIWKGFDDDDNYEITKMLHKADPEVTEVNSVPDQFKLLFADEDEDGVYFYTHADEVHV